MKGNTYGPWLMLCRNGAEPNNCLYNMLISHRSLLHIHLHIPAHTVGYQIEYDTINLYVWKENIFVCLSNGDFSRQVKMKNCLFH